jgi:hypothetical protein
MLWNSLLKNPILAIGIIMFGLFLYQVFNKKDLSLQLNEKLNSSSCKAVLIRLEKKVPGNWKILCEGNNLAVEIYEVSLPEEASNLKTLMYRQLANHMSYVAKISTQDILEKVFFVRFKIVHKKMEINAVTEGKYIVKLNTLDSIDHILSHLKSTVQVNEIIK